MSIEDVSLPAPERTLQDFWVEQGEWSEETFGPSAERGPAGPLRHLQKEIGELAAADLEEELADCLFLVFDAARRAGMTHGDMVYAVFAKLSKNKRRKWSVPSNPDQPVEHVR